jgi:HK97 family phage major capsid protein
MADINKELENVEVEAGDALVIAPLLDGLKKVAKRATETEASTKKAVDEIRVQVKHDIEAFKEVQEKSTSDILDRLETYNKRTSSLNRQFEQDDASALKEAVPERFHKNLGHYEGLASVKDGIFGDARYIEAKHAWFNIASKLQLRHYDGERESLRAELTKIESRFDSITKADMAGLADTSGGYSVPNIVGNEVLKIIRDASLIYSRARQLPMTSDTLSFPDEATAVTINWSNTDGTTLTAGEPVFGVKTLNARKLIGRATFSLELLDDANVAIVPFLQSCFAEKMGGELDFQAVEGAGAPFTGVLNATSVNDAARTNGTNGALLKWSSALATEASLTQILTKAGEADPRDNGIFVCNPAMYGTLIGLSDSNGSPILRLGTAEGRPADTVIGRPIVCSARLAAATTIGAGTNLTAALYFGPPSALLFGVRQGMRWDVSDQVNWAKYQADARMVGRFGYVVGVPTAWVKQGGIRV